METRKKRSERLSDAQNQERTEEKQGEAACECGDNQGQAAPCAEQLTINLICTITAMLSPLALFFVFAEKENKMIRHAAVQSVGLAAAHMSCGLLILLFGAVLGPVPILGFVTALACWLIYLSVLTSVLIARVRMMLHAWRGERYELPLLGTRLSRFE